MSGQSLIQQPSYMDSILDDLPYDPTLFEFDEFDWLDQSTHPHQIDEVQSSQPTASPVLPDFSQPGSRMQACKKGRQEKPPRPNEPSGYSCFLLNGKPISSRRRAAYSAERRLKVKEIRGVGACLRCRLLKRPCSKGNPCDRCLKDCNIIESRLAAKCLAWMECIRPSLTHFKIFESDINAKDYTLEAALDSIRPLDIQLEFSIPFDWNVAALCVYIGKWLDNDSDPVPMSCVGLFSSAKFASLLSPLLGSEFAQNLRHFIYASSNSYLTRDAERQVKPVFSLVANHLGARLLAVLENNLSSKKLAECSADKLRALSVAVLVVIIATSNQNKVLRDTWSAEKLLSLATVQWRSSASYTWMNWGDPSDASILLGCCHRGEEETTSMQWWQTTEMQLPIAEPSGLPLELESKRTTGKPIPQSKTDSLNKTKVRLNKTSYDMHVELVGGRLEGSDGFTAAHASDGICRIVGEEFWNSGLQQGGLIPNSAMEIEPATVLVGTTGLLKNFPRDFSPGAEPITSIDPLDPIPDVMAGNTPCSVNADFGVTDLLGAQIDQRPPASPWPLYTSNIEIFQTPAPQIWNEDSIDVFFGSVEPQSDVTTLNPQSLVRWGSPSTSSQIYRPKYPRTSRTHPSSRPSVQKGY
ncbi:MAG: hypothetical protein M1820_007660 [Bogoriella megaspora]|nr:MAG: hypothetical protein M1820_007660 [Bogoriella megaspora]